MNKDKNKNEKIMTNIDKNKIKSNSLSSPLSRSATKRMNNQTEDKLLAHALEPNSQYENKIKIEKLLKSSTIEEKKIKKKHLIDYGERKIIHIVGGKKKKCDFPANFITENSTSKKNKRINSKPCSKKNRNSQISFESSIGPENVLFNGKDTSYVEFLSSVNLIRENIVRGTKAARTEIHPRTDTIENIELHGEVSESEGEGGVEERKSDNDSDSLSPNTHNMRNFDYSDVDINKSGISDPECLNNSIRDVLINSYNASLHDSMIDTYDIFNTVRTAEYLKYRSNETGVTVSYSVPSISTSTSIPVHMTATSHSHNLRNQNIAIGEYEEEQEGGIVEREKEKGSAGVRTQSPSVIGAYEKSESIQTLAPAHTSATLTKTRTQTETGMGTGIGMETVTGMGTVTVTGTGIETGRGRGMGVDEGFMKAERSSEDWIAWARRGARLPLSDSVNTIINTNNLTSTSTSTSMQNKSEKEFQDPGSEVGIKGNVFYHEDFLPVFSTKVIESSRNINRIEYDNVSGGKIQGTINNNYNDNNDTNDDKINEKNEKREQINKMSVNNNNDNNHYYDNNKKIDKKNDEVENNRHKEVENEDEDDLLVYDMPQYYDDYYEYNRVLDNNKTYYSDPITVNDNDTTQSYNAKEYNEEDTQFKTKTEMNIYTELDETDPYTVSSEPYNFVHGIRKTENSSVSYAKDYEDGDEFYRVVDKVRGKVKVGKHTDKEDSYSSNKGIAFPLRGTRTDSRIKIKNTESSDLSDYHGPSAAILESYMKDIYEQSSN